MPRGGRPQGSLDIERILKRIEENSQQSFDALSKEITDLKVDVLRGNMEAEFIARRLSDVEMQVLETRSHMQITDRDGAEAAKVVAAQAVVAAKEVAKDAPKNVWKSKAGMITAGSAAFVAIVSFAKNLPPFARGAQEIAVAIWNYVVKHH